jgi:hypothetical protein
LLQSQTRAEGKLYGLSHVLLFSIFAIVSGANSYRGIQTYFKAHLRALNKAFKVKWKRAPAHTAIRYILQGLDAADVEKAFREHGANLNFAPDMAGACVIAFDGKTLKGSFDNFNDAKAKQVLSAFAVDKALVLPRRGSVAAVFSIVACSVPASPAYPPPRRPFDERALP